MVGQTRPPARHRRDARKLESCRRDEISSHGKRNTYGTTLFGDGVRFEAFRAFGGGRKLMETLKSGEAFLSLQALSNSRRSEPRAAGRLWNYGASARRRPRGPPSTPAAARRRSAAPRWPYQ